MRFTTLAWFFPAVISASDVTVAYLYVIPRKRDIHLLTYSTNLSTSQSMDTQCDTYAPSPPNTPQDGSCYTWEWTGSQGAKITACADGIVCSCAFFSDTNCNNMVTMLDYKSGDCASYPGHGFGSFWCEAMIYEFSDNP